MVRVTIRILDGAGRGRVFEDLVPPVTIGREEGNTIQVNDDRVSRYHLKIQEDDAKLVLTDLESTNGTKVNGEDIQLRILRYGDMITVGRSVLLVGSRDEIADRLAHLRGAPEMRTQRDDEDDGAREDALEQMDRLASELEWNEDNEDMQATLHVLQPPELPTGLSPGQAAQLSELLEYMHIRLRRLLATGREEDGERMSIAMRQWQDLVDLHARIAAYLRQVGEP